MHNINDGCFFHERMTKDKDWLKYSSALSLARYATIPLYTEDTPNKLEFCKTQGINWAPTRSEMHTKGKF
ncbi:hypothetical protein RB195_025177 [Necator americanus]|uniref:Uncharacterized protein n=1 Tax=Necator americanus TaxID=51031 RepID=A0ABR1ERR2_NECAM